MTSQPFTRHTFCSLGAVLANGTLGGHIAHCAVQDHTQVKQAHLSRSVTDMFTCNC
eukprot:m.29420 g.29420  ORF g.29420 m.29420 type:complete len:56 (+) comp9160_c1_seq1:6116-6283(+)